jgi:hypothetical protein
MPIGPRERTGDKMLAWTFAAALVLGLVALLAAASESLRRQGPASSVTGAAEPDLPSPPSEGPDAHHATGDAGWPVP